jgi:hypothetical protein
VNSGAVPAPETQWRTCLDGDLHTCRLSVFRRQLKFKFKIPLFKQIYNIYIYMNGVMISKIIHQTKQNDISEFKNFESHLAALVDLCCVVYIMVLDVIFNPIMQLIKRFF